MVCFCSPDVSWLKNIEKSFETNCKLFMPLWNYDELKDACESLELDIPNLKDRYEKIGGVIRLIFAPKNVYKKHLEAIRCTVYCLESCYQLYETLASSSEYFQKLIYFYPKTIIYKQASFQEIVFNWKGEPEFSAAECLYPCDYNLNTTEFIIKLIMDRIFVFEALKRLFMLQIHPRFKCLCNNEKFHVQNSPK